MANSLQPAFSPQSGVTISELLVVMVVIAVIAGFALLQRGGADEQFKRQNVARELKVAFERARFDSVKRRADGTDVPQAKVIVNASSFVLVTDQNQDGVLDTSDEQHTDFTGQNIVVGLDESVSFPVTLTYSQRGEAMASDPSGEVKPIFVICNVSCSAPTNVNSNIIVVTPTGTVNLLPGGSTLPNFSPPGGLTSVPPTNSINNTAAVTPTP